MTALHPRLAAAFAALDEAGVRWCLLREPSDPAAPRGDVDLLVDPQAAPVIAAVLTGQGFVAVPGWTRLPSMLWMAYEDGRFLLLELTDQVSFGPEGSLATGLGPDCLARRRQYGPQYLLDPDDGFWALLLHCLLDKADVPVHYRDRLQAMASGARPDGPLGSLVAGAEVLREAVLAGRWGQVLAEARPVHDAWQQWLRWRAALFRTRRVLRAPLLVRRRRGLGVALLGLNGAGKSTLTRGIADRFPFPVTEVYLGLWRSGDLPVLAPILRPALAWRRYLTGMRARLLGRLVVFDRYVHDARLPPAPPHLAAKRVYMWLLARCVPSPDLVLLLDVPADLATERKDERTREQNEVERAGYLAMRGITVVDANRPADVVLRDVLALIWARYRARWGA